LSMWPAGLDTACARAAAAEWRYAFLALGRRSSTPRTQRETAGRALDHARLARGATRERGSCRSVASIGGRSFDRRLAPSLAGGMGGSGGRGGSASAGRGLRKHHPPPGPSAGVPPAL